MKKLNTNKNGYPCIYSIRNTINNKIYIGSAIGHYRRKGQHYYMLRRNNHFNKHLQSSWNKYGESNFEFKILEFITNINKLETREKHWINKYNSINNTLGYNSRIDCKTNLGLKWSEISKKKFSDSKKGKKINHLDYNEIAKVNMKKVKAKNIKENITLYFDSLKEAAVEMKVNPSNISKACNKKIKSCKGYIWDFVEQSTLKNPVNSGKILIKDNPEPSSLNSIEVDEKVQRLTVEELTNKTDTSAGQPGINGKTFKIYLKDKFFSSVDDIV